jgi:hypothetical protein
MLKILKSLLTWLGIVVAQWFGANLCVFILSLFLYTDQPATWSRFMINVAFMGVGFLIGIYWAGMLILRRLRVAELLPRARFFTTLAGCLLPLLALAIYSWSVYHARPVEFQTLIVEDWQVRLAQTALWLAILGFHLPGWFKQLTGRPVVPVQEVQ